ncbi:MAG: DegT/DnrJ/EryC1/StrS family aminotransferase [Gammaproteobacteria bacterium]|jgi:dTDP-4-amino-4,6-dideoxygalactose transaminase|nr:DegT/DnrJ/EryC1/StrS family aminotransferase [Gammaproteobacteria bacterium]|tara:strand:+ start:153 stop:1262 length:1110 start_codon:yes stop_codon:yes gene_type:complete
MPKQPIFVTRPSLPPLEDLIPYLEQIWESKVLTNNGPFHRQLEDALCKYLDVPHISLFSNGTIALITALKVLDIQGEVITTPYSFVATAHSLLWNGITPVFVDIDPVTLNLDPGKIEAAITPRTTAIMPVHVYGHPCDVDAIEASAKKHKLKVIYDAAHAFGVESHCGSMFNHGDLSVLSFHATKVFNTFEGGAIICKDPHMKARIDKLKNFGYAGEVNVADVGINGKMSEFNAALGLLQLERIDELIGKRKQVDLAYRKGLYGVKGVHYLNNMDERLANYGYFPLLINHDYPISRDDLYDRMKVNGIHPRRYFYPLISNFPMYSGLPSSAPDNLIVATKVAKQVLCLPIYPDLAMEMIEEICHFIAEQ